MSERANAASGIQITVACCAALLYNGMDNSVKVVIRDAAS